MEPVILVQRTDRVHEVGHEVGHIGLARQLLRDLERVLEGWPILNELVNQKIMGPLTKTLGIGRVSMLSRRPPQSLRPCRSRRLRPVQRCRSRDISFQRFE